MQNLLVIATHGKVQLVNDPIWLSDAKSLIAKYNTEINSLSLLNITY